MTSPPDRLPSEHDLPEKTAVVVIGGGIIGASTALSLAEKGIEVVLCEKGEIGAEQSSRNWGWCRTQGRDPREIPLSLEAMRMWRGLNEKVEGETGFRSDGVIYLWRTTRISDDTTGVAQQAKLYQVDARMLPSAEISGLPSRGHRAGPAGHIFAERRARGTAEGSTRIAGRRPPTRCHHTHDCAVRGSRLPAGRVSAVVTETRPHRMR